MNKEKTYEQGLEEAWDIARKIVTSCHGCFLSRDLDDIFGKVRPSAREIIYEFPNIHEVKDKIDAWEAEKAKPKLGDVVKVTGIDSHNSFNAIVYCDEGCDGVGDIWALVPGSMAPQLLSKKMFTFEKTGKHFDIQSMLDEIVKE